MKVSPEHPVVGVLRAGGRSRRMGGGDKCLAELAGETLLARAFARLAPQVGALVLNANDDAARFAAFDLPVVADVVAEQPGPLAGVLTGMAWARERATDARWILTAPTDAPFLPTDLCGRLRRAAEDGGAEIACASSGGRTHPVVALWSVALRDALREALVEREIRKVDRFTAAHRVAHVEWPTSPVDPFFNVNRFEDLAEAERLIEAAVGS